MEYAAPRKSRYRNSRNGDGQLLYRNCRYVPDDQALRLRLMQDHHDPPAIGHLGRAKTLDLLSRQYCWSSMRKDVERFVRTATPAEEPKRLAMLRTAFSSPCPSRRNLGNTSPSISSLGFDAICVFVNRLTKQRHLLPCHTTISAVGFAELFCDRIFRYHGFPESIVSDRGPQFASRFWNHLCQCPKIDPRLSTAFHPETDGQTEHMNAIMEQHLRAHVSYLQDDWTDYLFLAEFAGNNQISDTTTSGDRPHRWREIGTKRQGRARRRTRWRSKRSSDPRASGIGFHCNLLDAGSASFSFVISLVRFQCAF